MGRTGYARLLSAAAACWAVSTDHTAAVRTLGVHEEDVIVIPNGVETEHFRPLNLTAGERLALLRRRRQPARLGREWPGRQVCATPWPTCPPSPTPPGSARF
jgi:glycosyltransferase involved in cell wall biosynthesis